jgi:hypothetical protein
MLRLTPEADRPYSLQAQEQDAGLECGRCLRTGEDTHQPRDGDSSAVMGNLSLVDVNRRVIS